MTVRGADARKRRVSRLLTAVLTTALVGTLQFVAPPPAAAFIGNVIPANELEEPTDTFTTANALFAFVTTDPRGGRVCVVPESTSNPGDGSLSCDDAAAWASPNFVSGIGTVIIPVQGPSLKIGTWRLLADSSQGAADAISVPFTVRPCIDCDTTLADSILAKWKAAAAASGKGMGNICRASTVYGRLTQAKKAGKFIRAAASVSPVLSFVAVGSGGGGLLLSVIPSFTPQTVIKLGLDMIADLSCAVELMYEDIVADPPDPNFDEITTPAGIASPVSGDPLVDALSAGLSDVVAQGKAMRISMERYQGALVAGDTGAVAAQLGATAEFGETLAVKMRGLAADLRAFGAEADADPDENDPVLDQPGLTETILIYQRVQTQGFSDAELSQLTAAGLTPEQIQAVEDAFDLDMTSTPIGQSFNTVVQAAADNLEESADQFIEVALAAGAVAATLGAIDPAGPTAIDDVISTVAGAPSAVNVLANDTGAGALSVTASTNGAHGDVLCATSGLCTYSPAVGFTGTDSFTYTVTDGSGLTDIGSVAVTVGAVDPTNDPPIVDAGPDVALSESSRYFYRTPSIQDPDGTIQSSVWNYGDGTSSAGANASHQYATKGTFTATLTATDDDGAVGSDTVVVTITNADPVIQELQVPQRTAPDVERQVYVRFYDPGGLDTVTGVLDFGDGSSTVSLVSGAPVPHTWADPGTYTVTVTMDDGDGGTATRTASVLVKEATVDAGPDRSGNEGQELTFVRPLDGVQDHELGVSWDFGDGTVKGYPATSESPVTHTYRDSGVYTLTLTLYGGSLGGPISDTATVTLGNLNPSVSGIATTGLPVAGSPMSFNAFMSDPGVDDVLTASWDFGDGAVATGTAVQHTYAAAGTYTVMTIAEDDDGGASTASSTTVTVSSPGTTSGPIDSSGRDFWLAFNRNYYGVATSLTLFITAATTTSGTVEIPGIGFSVPFDVAAGTVTSVELPEDASLGAPPSGAPTIEPRGIHVRSQDDVSVYGLNYFKQTTDAFSGLPTDAVGTDYRVMTYPRGLGQEMSVVGTANDTVVTITPTVYLYEHAPGVPFEVTVDLGEVLNLPQPLVGGDLTGTRIQSSRPVAVFSGDVCAFVPSGVNFCDHLVEQLTPTSAWGRRFITTPLAARENGDTFRILAATDNTELRVNGVLVATLDAGEFHERILTEATLIDGSSPLLVAQFANGAALSGNPGDPFMMLIPPFEQFLNSYTVTTPASGFAQSYVSVVARGNGAGITLDGSAVPTTSFTPIGTSGYSEAVVAVEPGVHRLSAAQPFGLAIYGYNAEESYGYTGGLSLAAVATVIRVDLTPPSGAATLGTPACVTGTAVDVSGGPVAGVRMDFAVAGANPTSGFAVTDAAGAAEFCYTGTVAGLDTVTGTVSGIDDTATRTWSADEPNRAPTTLADTYDTARDSVLTVDAATGVLHNDSDPDGDSLTAAKVADPGHGSVVLAADGSFVYTPTAGYVGPDAFSYTANDALVPSAITTVSIDVTPVNHAPTLGLVIDQTIPEMVLFNLTLSGADPDGDTPLTYSMPTAQTGLSVGQATGVLDWAPTEAQGPGDYPVTIRVTDPDGLFAERSFTLHVTEVNRDPALAAVADRTANPGDAVSLTASGNDPDLPANTLAYSLVSGPSGAAIDSTTGAFSWTAGSTLGDYPVTIRVTDPDGLFAERSFTIHVVRDATTLTLDGDSSGQHSDNAKITATLRVGDTLVPGATVSIGLGAASTNVTTNASGVATATFAIPGPVASLPVTASFAGTASKAPSSVNGSFTVEREDSTVVYAGDAIGLAGSTLRLSAEFTDSSVAGFTGSNPETSSSATTGDVTKARVAFAIYSAASCLSGLPVATVSAFVADTGPTGDGIGTAEATWSSASEGSFCIVPTVVGAGGTGLNDYYTAPPAPAAGLAIYIDATGKVTGGGWIPLGDGRANFGFNANSDGSKAKGNLVFIERTMYLGKKVMLIVKSNAIDTLRASGSTFPISATLTGKASFKYISSVDGSTVFESGNATFSATVIDSGAAGGAGDAFAIRVLDRARSLLVELGSTPLGGGNVVAHLK